MAKKEKAEKAVAEDFTGMSLEQLILDKATTKYTLVSLAAEWAKQLRKSEEFRHLTQNEILDKALEDTIKGEVTWEMVEKSRVATAEAEAIAAVEEKKAKKASQTEE